VIFYTDILGLLLALLEKDYIKQEILDREDGGVKRY
jgi:hypothetical protein